MEVFLKTTMEGEYNACIRVWLINKELIIIRSSITVFFVNLSLKDCKNLIKNYIFNRIVNTVA